MSLCGCATGACACGNVTAGNPWRLSGLIMTSGSAGSAPTLRGWECPRCRGINAPHVERCSCTPQFAAPETPPAWPDYYAPWPLGTVTS